MATRKKSSKIEWDCIYNKNAMKLLYEKPKEGDIVNEKKIEKIEDKGDHYLIKWYE